MSEARSSKLEAQGSLETVEDARTSLLSLALACRSIGKATSVDRMESLDREYPAASRILEAFSEVLPRQVGRMLAGLLEEAQALGQAQAQAQAQVMRAAVFDPRSFRQAADAAEIVAEKAPNEVLLAYEALPENRWPKRQICDVGLFLMGLMIRGVSSVRPLHGQLWIADAHISLQEVERATEELLSWHRTYATAAFAAVVKARAQAQAQDVPRAPVPVPVPTLLPPALLLSDGEANKLDSLLLLADHSGLEPGRRLAFRRMVGASLFVFLRLLQRPYAVLFQSQLLFEPAEGASSFVPPRTIRVGTDGDLWGVVRALAEALDRSFGGWSSFRSEEEGPVRAFGEAVGGVDPSSSFSDFTVAYLQVLVRQQGVLEKAPAQAQVDKVVVRRLHPQFLELILDEQKRCLVEEGKRIGSTRIENLVTAGAGAAGLPLLTWLLPKVAVK